MIDYIFLFRVKVYLDLLKALPEYELGEDGEGGGGGEGEGMGWRKYTF